MSYHRYLLEAHSLSILGNLKNTNIMKLTIKLLESFDLKLQDFLEAYSAYCKFILENDSASNLFDQELLYDENAFAKSAWKTEFSNLDYLLCQATEFDLSVIRHLSSLCAEELLLEAQRVFEKDKDFLSALPQFPASSVFFIKNLEDIYTLYHENGYGFFAKGQSFFVENGVPHFIEKPDSIRLSDLKGYERQKRAIVQNTLSFLRGKESNNILLYGDKGTGKSSAVKAIGNEYANLGLKIIELKITQISDFPKLCEMVGRSPFKFIIFLDDLSFHQEDSNFASLKAFIEGGVAGKPDNLLIYATSNRRHLVREGLSERSRGDDIHLRDTLETVTSLSDRFGLEITFTVPDKDEYLSIVEILAEEYGLELEKKELYLLAERFAIKRGGRSPRTARQFVNHQISLFTQESL